METLLKITAVGIITLVIFTLDNGIEFKLRTGLCVLNVVLCWAIFFASLDIANGKKMDALYYIWVILICLVVFFIKAKESEYKPFLSLAFINMAIYVAILDLIRLLVKYGKL